ncbi:MAG TPA: hypothetical protein VM925_27170 [Labilithrix sp.]|nr:hypothetical protein [Labilithrix sp.]
MFALASVSALTGMVTTVAAAGCSSKDDAPKAPDAAIDTKARDAGPQPQPDGGEDDTSETGPCLVQNAIDATKFPYTKAVKSPGACTTKELDELAKFFKAKAGAEDIKMSDWAAVVGPSCAKCVFSDGTGTEWTPILTKNDKLDNVNRGGCIEIVSGKQACGEAYQQATECRMTACVTDCKTQDEFMDCLADSAAIFSGPCKGAYEAIDKECGKDLDAYEQACKGTTWTFEGPVTVQCITGGAGGGGADGG